MMKYLFTFFSLVTFNFLNAQVNEIELASFISPDGSLIPDTNRVSDITVRIQNFGPNTIFSFDTLYFTVDIATEDTTISRRVKVRANTTTAVNMTSVHTLIQNYDFDTSEVYTVCADIEGTKSYPTNSSKINRRRCITFLVNAAEYELSLNKVFYANGQLNFHLSENLINADAMVLDITGKQLIRQRLNNAKNQALKFQPYAKGFYFLKIIESNGKATVSKFVIN